MSTLFLIFPWVLGLIVIGTFVKICVSAWGQCRLGFRIFIAFFVVLIVFPACYYAGFLIFDYLVPPEFGMPAYEDEIELAFMVGSVAFSAVPLFISIKVCAFLNRHFLIRRLGSDDVKPLSDGVTGGTRDQANLPPAETGNLNQSPRNPEDAHKRMNRSGDSGD